MLLSGLFVMPLGAHAQEPRLPVIGMLHGGSPAPYARHLAAFREALGAAGYVESKNVAIEYRWAEGSYDRLSEMAGDLVSRGVAVIAAMTFPAALAAKSATSTIPIVFDSGSDPVAEGLVNSLSRPGGNLTGISLFLTTLGPKRLELLHRLVPEAGIIGLLVNPERPSAEAQIRDLKEAAGTISVQISVVRARSDGELANGFAALAERRIGALVIGADAFFNSRREKLTTLASRYAIPAIYFDREFAAAGGLVGYGADLVDTYRGVAVYVAKVLGGAKPADLPVEQPTKFELVINLKSAKALGLTVPPSLLELADEVIE